MTAISDRPRIVFFGNERLATGVSTTAPTLRRLIEAGYDVVAVVSHHTESTSRRTRQLEIAEVAAEHNIPVLLPEKPAEIFDQLRDMRADIGVLVAYGKIVPQSVIDIFPHGIANIHPSLLPLHRGPTPIESVILDGSTETGVSIMQLVRAMDAGPVHGQVHLALTGSETKQQLADRLLEMGGELLIKLLPGILRGELQPTAQDDSQATYDALIAKSDGEIDLSKPAEQLAREVRAYAEWPKSRTNVYGTDVIITKAHAEPAASEAAAKQLALQTADGLFVIDALKPAGKQEMTAQAFLAGYGSRPRSSQT